MCDVDDEYDSCDSNSDSEYDLCDSDSDTDSEETSDSKPYLSNTKRWVSMLFDSGSNSDSNSDSDSDSEYDSCDSGYDLCDNGGGDNEYDSCDKTDINDNKEIINQLNIFITLRKSFLNYINKIEVLKSEIQDDIYSDLPLLKYARMNKINECLMNH